MAAFSQVLVIMISKLTYSTICRKTFQTACLQFYAQYIFYPQRS